MKKVKFYSLLPDHTKDFPIKKASITDFSWMEKMKEDFKKTDKSKQHLHTATCPGIIQMVKKGWLQYSYQDFEISTNGDGESFQWRSEIDQQSIQLGEFNVGPYVHYHTPDQFNKFKEFPDNCLRTIIKINTPWFVEIPEGYSVLRLPVPNQDENRFTVIPGVLHYNNFLNIQMYWHCLNSVETIKKGTPLCQIILIENKELDFEIKKFDDLDSFKKLYKPATEYWDSPNVKL